jgi:hypothetical protein
MFALCFPLLSASPAFSQDPFYQKKQEIGGFLSPIEIIYWPTLPGGDNARPKRIYENSASPIGINYGYKLYNFLSLRIGMAYTTEHFAYNFLKVHYILKSLDYNMSYLRVPLSARVYTNNITDDNMDSGFFLEVQGILDFIVREDIVAETTTSYYDNHFSPPPGGWPPLPVTRTETHSNKVRFNRICPLLFIGKEFVFEHTTFYFGGKLEFPSVYEERNTQELWRNIKVSPMNVGLSYRF